MPAALAVVAALVNAVTSVLQRLGVESAPPSAALRLGLLAHAVRRPVWLVGFALMLVEFGLQAIALRFGQLSLVQPLLTTELLFLVAILGTWFHFSIGWREWAGAGAVVAGLGGFFATARPSGGHHLATASTWVVASVVTVACIAGFVVAGTRGPRWWRAASFGAATALTAAYSASLTKATTTYVSEGWGHVFTHAQPYLLGVAGVATVFLLQNALHAGPIAASRTTLITLNPLASIGLGVGLFGDRLASGGTATAAEAASLAVLVAGAAVLARSPLVSGTPGDLASEDELLGTARQRVSP